MLCGCGPNAVIRSHSPLLPRYDESGVFIGGDNVQSYSQDDSMTSEKGHMTSEKAKLLGSGKKSVLHSDQTYPGCFTFACSQRPVDMYGPNAHNSSFQFLTSVPEKVTSPILEVADYGVYTSNAQHTRTPYRGQLKIHVYVNSGLLTVHIIESRHLYTECGLESNAYVKVSLEPDETKRSTCKTLVRKDASSHKFDEKFSFELIEGDMKKRLLISAWHKESQHSPSELLGCMSFGVKHVIQKKTIANGWYYLLSEQMGKRKHLHVNIYKQTTSSGHTSDDSRNISKKDGIYKMTPPLDQSMTSQMTQDSGDCTTPGCTVLTKPQVPRIHETVQHTQIPAFSLDESRDTGQSGTSSGTTLPPYSPPNPSTEVIQLFVIKADVGFGLMLTGNKPVRVLHIKPGGPCDVSGIRRDDVLLSINEHDVTTLSADTVARVLRQCEGTTKFWIERISKPPDILNGIPHQPQSALIHDHGKVQNDQRTQHTHTSNGMQQSEMVKQTNVISDNRQQTHLIHHDTDAKYLDTLHRNQITNQRQYDAHNQPSNAMQEFQHRSKQESVDKTVSIMKEMQDGFFNNNLLVDDEEVMLINRKHEPAKRAPDYENVYSDSNEVSSMSYSSGSYNNSSQQTRDSYQNQITQTQNQNKEYQANKLPGEYQRQASTGFATSHLNNLAINQTNGRAQNQNDANFKNDKVHDNRNPALLNPWQGKTVPNKWSPNNIPNGSNLNKSSHINHNALTANQGLESTKTEKQHTHQNIPSQMNAPALSNTNSRINNTATMVTGQPPPYPGASSWFKQQGNNGQVNVTNRISQNGHQLGTSSTLSPTQQKLSNFPQNGAAQFQNLSPQNGYKPSIVQTQNSNNMHIQNRNMVTTQPTSQNSLKPRQINPMEPYNPHRLKDVSSSNTGPTAAMLDTRMNGLNIDSNRSENSKQHMNPRDMIRVSDVSQFQNHQSSSHSKFTATNQYQITNMNTT